MKEENDQGRVKRIDPEIKELVLWRIESEIPSNFKLSIGGGESLSKEQLKEHVEAEDQIGLQIIKMQLNFIKALSSGEFAKALAE
jgi:hypothetical protein